LEKKKKKKMTFYRKNFSRTLGFLSAGADVAPTPEHVSSVCFDFLTSGAHWGTLGPSGARRWGTPLGGVGNFGVGEEIAAALLPRDTIWGRVGRVRHRWVTMYE
jgi:hypothetical protein